jgi:hypothetical protein
LTTFFFVADQARGDIKGLLRLDRGRHHAAEHDAVTNAFDADIAGRKHLPECTAHAVEIARHGDVEAGELPAFGIEEIDVRLPDGDADQIGTPHRAKHGGGELWVGDKDILDVTRQVDDDRLSDAQSYVIRTKIGGRHCSPCGGRQRARCRCREIRRHEKHWQACRRDCDVA